MLERIYLPRLYEFLCNRRFLSATLLSRYQFMSRLRPSLSSLSLQPLLDMDMICDDNVKLYEKMSKWINCRIAERRLSLTFLNHELKWYAVHVNFRLVYKHVATWALFMIYNFAMCLLLSSIVYSLCRSRLELSLKK